MTSPPPRSRGIIALLEENCTICMLCAQECPDWCISIEGHTEPVPGRGAREHTRNVLDRFAIDFALCMYCGICVDVCPFDALFWAPALEPGADVLGGLTVERGGLREWMASVPEPPAYDEGAAPTAERVAAARRGERAPRGPR